MRLTTAYVRFYRAFNHDFLRRSEPDPGRNPWDVMEDGSHYPFVKIPIDPKLTCVVGANESGKSQLLDAIEIALGRKEPSPVDFCRYSEFFTVSEGLRLPDTGVRLDNIEPAEAAAIQELVGGSQDQEIEFLKVFRTHPSKVDLFLNNDKEPVTITDKADSLTDLLPEVIRIERNRALPDSVPLDYLTSQESTGLSRSAQLSLLDSFLKVAQTLPEDFAKPEESRSTSSKTLMNQIESEFSMSDPERRERIGQWKLARELLVTVAEIGPEAFPMLRQALRDGHEGLASGIKVKMDELIEDSLNLAKWWSQDSQFRLTIEIRDHSLVLTIRDRTGSLYTFDERSGGLKYFLSYLVQALTHIKVRSRRGVLLMDEPDTYLSNQGQQDLLRVLNEFAEPVGDIPQAQVIYVTHSPFLIDKNRGDRIRVLDKGIREEGTRIVRDVGRNHFEPLRTALGGLVGETFFIGNCNLMLEGMADQIYLSGMSDILSRDEGNPGTDFLDLNRITLVPSGGASEVPYRVYLARGRDRDKPAVIALLDGDEAGNEAVKELRRSRRYNTELLQEQYIAQIAPGRIAGLESDRSGGPREIEDLVPVEIGVRAAKEFLKDMDVEYQQAKLSVDAVRGNLEGSIGIFAAIQSAVVDATEDFRFDDKTPFARYVVEECRGASDLHTSKMEMRFAALFRHLSLMQREAERERNREAIRARVDRETRAFLRDRRGTCFKSDVSRLLETIRHQIDEAMEGEILVRAMAQMHVDFQLDQNPQKRIEGDEFTRLKSRIQGLKYEELRASQPVPSASDEEQVNESTTVSEDDSPPLPGPTEEIGSNEGEQVPTEDG